MGSISRVLDVDNPVFCAYLTYSSALVLKMLLMSVLTSRQRKLHGVPISPEDALFHNVKFPRKTHQSVERVRRAHLNDVENIPIFLIAGFTYMLTDPAPETALNLFRLYTAARCIHTFVYAICVMPQPARGISWVSGYLVTGYMAAKTLYHFQSF